jgi:hypothetical protein
MSFSLPKTAYSEPEKIEARRVALTHAIEILTSRRRDAPAVPQSHVRRVRDLLVSRSNSADQMFARQCDNSTIELWEQLWSTNVGTKRPEELSVAYLAGPNPLNDFRQLVELGIHPSNVWAFESGNAEFAAGLESIKASEFPQIKLYGGSIEQFFQAVPKAFDIVYLDACGPLPSSSQATLRTVSTLFRHNRLASVGTLITNFARPDISNAEIRIAYCDLISSYMYPKGMVESGDPTWNLRDGAIAYGLIPKDSEQSDRSFFHQVSDDFEGFYGQYITRQLFDLGSFIAPWTRIANTDLWSSLFIKKPLEVSKEVEEMRHFGEEGDGGDFIVDADMYPLNWTVSALLNGSNGKVDVNYPTIAPESAKLAHRWITELAGLPKVSCDARTALEAYELLRSNDGGKLRTARFNGVLQNYNYMSHMFQFCDVPTNELAFFAAIAQLAYPYHYNVSETKRYQYTATGKSTPMFLDVIPFDNCRYIYDWLPTLELVVNSFETVAHQLTYRFALDGLAKQTMRYNNEYFYGGNVVGVNEEGFEEKLLVPRLKIG